MTPTCAAQPCAGFLPEPAYQAVVPPAGRRRRYGFPVIEPAASNADIAHGSGCGAVLVCGSADGPVPEHSEGMRALGGLAGKERHQRLRRRTVVAAEPRGSTVVVVDDHGGEVLPLHPVQHLDVEVWVPAEAMPSPGDLHSGRDRTPVPAEQQFRRAATDPAQQVPGPVA